MTMTTHFDAHTQVQVRVEVLQNCTRVELEYKYNSTSTKYYISDGNSRLQKLYTLHVAYVSNSVIL